MMTNMIQRLAIRVAAIVSLLTPLLAFAADEEARVDAKVQNFMKPVALEESSSALTWILLIFLGAVVISVMFKNAKRTHLD